MQYRKKTSTEVSFNIQNSLIKNYHFLNQFLINPYVKITRVTENHDSVDDPVLMNRARYATIQS